MCVPPCWKVSGTGTGFRRHVKQGGLSCLLRCSWCPPACFCRVCQNWGDVTGRARTRVKLLLFLTLLQTLVQLRRLVVGLGSRSDLCMWVEVGLQDVRVPPVSEGISPCVLGDGVSCYPLDSEQRTASRGVLRRLCHEPQHPWLYAMQGTSSSSDPSLLCFNQAPPPHHAVSRKRRRGVFEDSNPSQI